MRKLLISLASVALACALAIAPAATAKPSKPKATIVETVIDLSGPSGFDGDHGDFDILRDAVVATGLDAKLDGKRQLTVFAPSDQAFLDLTGTATEADAFNVVASLGLPAVKQVLRYRHRARQALAPSRSWPRSGSRPCCRRRSSPSAAARSSSRTPPVARSRSSRRMRHEPRTVSST